jgi:hypothetical protein
MLTDTDPKVINDLADLLDEYEVANKVYVESKQNLDSIKSQIIALLESNEIKTTDVKTDHGTYKVTRVQGEKTIVDESGLKNSLGTRFSSVATLTLDQDKLMKAILSGNLQKDEVAPFLSTKKNGAYAKITRVEDA